jgi:UDPglucose--hexose-1-phosphate uridylyltransferase
MPELRIDPIIGRRVYVAEERAGRPNDYELSPPPLKGGVRGGISGAGSLSPTATSSGMQNPSPNLSPQGRGTCCFCAGNEVHTPVESAAVRYANGHWQVRVVPNKYPAVTLDAPDSDAFGAHEVIIESPEHVLRLVQLSIEHIATILSVYRDRLAHWAADRRFKHAVVFKNSGYDAGASLEHVHSQLVALPYVPAAVQAELDGAAAYRKQHGRCVFCDLIDRERSAAERTVIQTDRYVAVAAYAPRQPYETWVLPRRHAARFDRMPDSELAEQAAVLHEQLRRLDAAAPDAPYNLLLHTGPFDGEDSFHWHWELVPRLTHEAGLEWGGGVYITPLSPERAAKRLREAF